MNKVTYIIGAGASAEALPLVKSNPDLKIEGLPDAFRRVGDQLVNQNKDDRLIKSALSIKTDLYWLAEKSELFNTVDTFAKYCYLQDKKQLTLIKKLLAIYFTADQTIIKKIDSRYLVFFTTVLENSYQFPDAIKILNWNYDSQFQLASYRFKQEAFILNSNNSFMQSEPLINYYPGIGMYSVPHETSYKNYSLVHLNGIAGYFQDKEDVVYNTLTENDTIEDFLDNTIKYIEQNSNLLTFAWESSSHHRISKSLAIGKEIIKGSEILVIIGYSFPFFNREIDKELFNVLIQSGLKKIYYQDKFRNGDFLINQFGLSDSIEINSIDKVDQLFIPIEL
jgi:hypothetical protein